MSSYFGRNLRLGHEREAVLDAFFSVRGFDIYPATPEEQRTGIDRWFNGELGGRFSVEYKSDSTSQRTGNAFVETVSVDTEDKPGWALTCKADCLMYYVLGHEVIYCFRPEVIRAVLLPWRRQYPEVPVQNDGYQTWGLKVPLEEFANAAFHRINMATWRADYVAERSA